MGQKIKKTKSDVQKEKLKKIIIDIITTNISICEFHLVNEKSDTKEYKALKKMISDSKKSIEIIERVNHIEILASLYNSFISGKESYFAIASMVVGKNVKKWDTNNFDEFLKLDEEARNKAREEFEEREKTAETIKKAREEGKRIDMVYENGKIKPVVVEEKKD